MTFPTVASPPRHISYKPQTDKQEDTDTHIHTPPHSYPTTHTHTHTNTHHHHTPTPLHTHTHTHTHTQTHTHTHHYTRITPQSNPITILPHYTRTLPNSQSHSTQPLSHNPNISSLMHRSRDSIMVCNGDCSGLDVRCDGVRCGIHG